MNNDEKKILIKIIAIVLVVFYFAMPPHNKIAQWGFVFNNIARFFESSPANMEKTEYLFHRNNAIYLVRMDNKIAALREMDKAVATFPVSLPDEQLYSLYSERAKVRLYYGDYKGALTDYLRNPNPNMNDMLKIAMLFKKEGKRKTAVSYCNKIIEMDIRAYAGYACMADVYADAGKYESSVTIMDLLIDRCPNKAKYHWDRAMYKEKVGDIKGAEEDRKKADELSAGYVNTNSITEEALKPKVLDLTIS